MKTRITLLGASGCIGKQVSKVIADHPNELELIGVSVFTNEESLIQILAKHPNIKYVCLGDMMNLARIKALYPTIEVFQGNAGLEKLAAIAVDLVVNALVGFVGLRPTVAAIKAHNDLALANKECLVAAGELITKLLVENQVELYPIDSEHSAIYQCLKGEDYAGIRRLVLTASGGPFRDCELDELANVSVEQAIHHPTWVMGPKISVDSATLVNKGLEIIEAHYLFGFDYNKIDVVMQLESVVHSMVEYVDGSFKAVLGTPNMEVPIQYALFKGTHQPKYDANLKLNQPFSLHFRPINPRRWEAVMLAYEVGKRGGSYPTVFNAANEVAVAEFIKGGLPFNKIVEVIKQAISQHEECGVKTIEDIIAVDKMARQSALKICQKYPKGGK